MGSPSLGLIGGCSQRLGNRRREEKTDVVDSCTPSTFADKREVTRDACRARKGI